MRCGRSARLAHGICAMHDWTSLCVGKVWVCFFLFLSQYDCSLGSGDHGHKYLDKWKMIVYDSELYFE